MTQFTNRFYKTGKLALTIQICLFMIIGCAHSPENTNSDPNALSFFVKSDELANHDYANMDSTWSLKTSFLSKTIRPKTFFYDFDINSESESFKILDINHKYGNYGRWRLIEKKNHLNETNTNQFSHSHKLRNFPITIKKSGNAHNQILRISLLTKDEKVKKIDMIFGVDKCLSKKDREALCF